MAKSYFNCLTIYRCKSYIPIAVSKCCVAFVLTLRKIRQYWNTFTTSNMNILFEYYSKYTKYVSSGCMLKKKHQKYEWQHFVGYQRTKTGYNGLYQTAKKAWWKNMNDNILLVIKRVKQDILVMVYINIFKLDWNTSCF